MSTKLCSNLQNRTSKIPKAYFNPSLVQKMQEFCIVVLARGCCLLDNAEAGLIIGGHFREETNYDNYHVG